MKLFKKNRILKIIFSFLPIITIFSSCYGDIMHDVFRDVQSNIIYIGDKESTVGQTVLQEQKEATGWLTVDTKEPLIVRIVKFILKMTIVLSVTMVIYYSVKFLLQIFSGNDLKSIGAKKDLINLIIGLLIALFSVTAIELIISIPKSSLRTSGDFGYNYQSTINKIS